MNFIVIIIIHILTSIQSQVTLTTCLCFQESDEANRSKLSSILCCVFDYQTLRRKTVTLKFATFNEEKRLAIMDPSAVAPIEAT